VGQRHLRDHVLIRRKVNVGIVTCAEWSPEVVIGRLGDGAGQLGKVTVHRIYPNNRSDERKDAVGVAWDFNCESAVRNHVGTGMSSAGGDRSDKGGRDADYLAR
jgi:hypothetical protein